MTHNHHTFIPEKNTKTWRSGPFLSALVCACEQPTTLFCTLHARNWYKKREVWSCTSSHQASNGLVITSASALHVHFFIISHIETVTNPPHSGRITTEKHSPPYAVKTHPILAFYSPLRHPAGVIGAIATNPFTQWMSRMTLLLTITLNKSGVLASWFQWIWWNHHLPRSRSRFASIFCLFPSVVKCHQICY